MLKSPLAVVAILLAATAVCEAECRFTDQIKPVKVDFPKVANNTLNFVYASQTNVTKDADHVYMDLTESGSNMYITKIAITKKDGRKEYYSYTTKYRDGVLKETYYDGWVTLTATSYILDKTDDDGILWYRCNEYSDLVKGFDMRYIVAPCGTTLRDESVNQLMETDRRFNFTGHLFKLTHKLSHKAHLVDVVLT